MFRKFVCVFLIVWLVASPAYASTTSSSAIDWQAVPMSLDDGIMTAANGSVSASFRSMYYDLSDNAFYFSDTAALTNLESTVVNIGQGEWWNSYSYIPSADSAYVGFKMNLDNISASNNSSARVLLNGLCMFYQNNDLMFWPTLNFSLTSPIKSYAVLNWSGSGKYTNPSTGGTSWVTLSGTRNVNVSVACSNFYDMLNTEFYPDYCYGRCAADLELSFDYSLPDTVTEDGYTYEVVSGSVSQASIYVIYPLRSEYLYLSNSESLSDRGIGIVGIPLDCNSFFVYSDGLPIVQYFSNSGSSGGGVGTMISSVNQSVSALSSKVSQGFSEVKQTIQQGASEVKNEISNQTQTLTDKLTDVKDGIVNGITELKETTEQGFQDVVQGITDLPGKIQEMLTEFIVPDEETMADKMTDFQSLAEDKLGVIYQVPNMLFDMAEGIVSGVTNPQGEMVLPKFEIIMPATSQTRAGETLTVWEEYRFPIWPAGTEVIQSAVQTATSMLCVILTFNSLKRKYEEWLDGH